MNEAKIKCPHCEVEYKVKWDEEAEPCTCPFCGGDTSITEDDAIFNDEEEQDSWN